VKPALPAVVSPKPEWLRIRLRTTPEFQEVRRSMRELSLNTVCEEARCPNIYECWSERTATFMILGDVCTRRCGFCAVTSGRPNAGVDADEPRHLAEAVAKLGIRHAVITSVDRDDLPDGGSAHFAAVMRALRERVPECAVEILTPDFKGVDDPLTPILAARPDIFSHNVETVPRLYRTARPGSSYTASLALLAEAVRRCAPRVKTGVMVGLGESHEELAATLRDIRDTGTAVLTVGQYLQPTTEHLPVARYVPPAEFEEIRAEGIALGFDHVEAGPLVRSSYHARDHYGAGGLSAARPETQVAGRSRLSAGRRVE
jgi:lipoic acid synthetase